MRFKSDKMDKIISDYDHEFNFNKRLKLMKAIDEVITENKSVIPLYHRKEAVVLPKNFSGFTDDFKATSLVYPERWSL